MYDWMKGAKLLQSALAGGCMDATIRLATEADAEGMLEVYASVVLETAISFDEGAAIAGGIPGTHSRRAGTAALARLRCWARYCGLCLRQPVQSAGKFQRIGPSPSPSSRSVPCPRANLQAPPNGILPCTAAARC